MCSPAASSRKEVLSHGNYETCRVCAELAERACDLAVELFTRWNQIAGMNILAEGVRLLSVRN
jgi:hypothetical protein